MCDVALDRSIYTLGSLNKTLKADDIIGFVIIVTLNERKELTKEGCIVT